MSEAYNWLDLCHPFPEDYTPRNTYRIEPLADGTPATSNAALSPPPSPLDSLVPYPSLCATIPDLRYPGPDNISTFLASALDLEALGFPPPPPLHLLAMISSHSFNEYPSPTNQSLSLSPDCRHSESPQCQESLSAFTFGNRSLSPLYRVQSPSLGTIHTPVLPHIDTPLPSPPSPANSLPSLPTEEENGHSDKEN